MITLTPEQSQVVSFPQPSKIFLHGPAGSGKTTAAVGRLLALLEAGVPGESILVLVPQRTLGAPYADALHTSEANSGGLVTILTVGGLAQRMVGIYWPLIAQQAGFGYPDQPPVFLTLETAQYYIAQLVQPLLEQGFFESVVMDRNRLYSQILDNLNKAAVVGFPYTEISQRLGNAWVGKPDQVRVYADAQHCATLFRQFCLANNLLDFSLQLEVFRDHLWPHPICQQYLQSTYRHLICDNLEEDNPAAHDILTTWLPVFESALVIYDENAGYRRFLGADPANAARLADLLPIKVRLSRSLVMSPDVEILQNTLAVNLTPPVVPESESALIPASPELDTSVSQQVSPATEVLSFAVHRFFPAMLDWISEQIVSLVQDGTPPAEIAVLSPFLSDALRFSLTHRLEMKGIPVRSQRPSRSLRDEPVTHCLFTLSMLAHPQWYAGLGRGAAPTRFDLAYTLVQAIEGLDLVRAHLLAEIVYRTHDGVPQLSSFDRIQPEMQQRITYWFGEKFEALRLWLEAYRQGPPQEMDHFLSRMFGEVLSQPGYGFHSQYLSGEITANLIESIQKFRWVTSEQLEARGQPLGLEYLEMVQDGVIAAQYIRSWLEQSEQAVWLAPAYTFLMANRPVDYQFWLDIGSRAWAERLYQPLTHAYVLSRHWPAGKQWTDLDEVETSQDALYRLTAGLLRRCRRGLFLGLSDLGEQGYEQRGPLMRAFQHVLRLSQTS